MSLWSVWLICSVYTKGIVTLMRRDGQGFGPSLGNRFKERVYLCRHEGDRRARLEAVLDSVTTNGDGAER